MNEAVQFEQIHSYLNGELTGTALVEFEAQMNSDPTLKAEVELHRDIDIALVDDTKIPFVQTLNKIHHAQETPNVEKVKSPWTRRRILRYAFAAAAAVLLAVFALPSLFPSEVNPMQLSENTIGDAPLLDTERSDSGDFDVTKNIAAINQKIAAKQYKEAIPILSELYNRTNYNEDGLSLGYCHLQVKNYSNAIAIFKKIGTENSDVYDAANWYLAHTYLRNGEKSTAKDILEQLIQHENTAKKIREQAENLLNSL